MAKRKLTSLRSVLLRYLLLCGGGCALILVLWWVIFMQLINIGFLLPAVASAQACADARETVASMTADTFDSLQISDLCRWAVVQNDTVLQTNMDRPPSENCPQCLSRRQRQSGVPSTMSKWLTEAFAFCSTTMLRPTPTRPCGTRCRISRPATLLLLAAAGHRLAGLADPLHRAGLCRRDRLSAPRGGCHRCAAARAH